MTVYARDLGLSEVDGAIVRTEKAKKPRKTIPRKSVKSGKTLSKFADLAIPTHAPKRKKVPKDKTPEAVIQAKVEHYLGLLGLDFFHVPEYVLNTSFGWNPTRTGPQINAMKNASQDIKGFPDLMITSRHHFGRVLFIELKRDGGKARPGQKEWARKVGAPLIDNYQDAVNAINAWVGTLETPPCRGGTYNERGE